jgi:hypothetical protein
VSDTWNVIAAPPRTPAAIIVKLNAAVGDIPRSPDVQAHFATINIRSAVHRRDPPRIWGRSSTETWCGRFAHSRRA